MTNTPDKIAERALKQAAGIKKYSDDAKGAPFDGGSIEKESGQIRDLNTKQESLKAQLHETTQQLNRGVKALDEKVSRNVSYFAAKWGKKDKRLEEVGGRALPEKRPRKKAGSGGAA